MKRFSNDCADHVYALFSGRSRQQSGDEAFFSDRLDVFSWSGQYLGTYTLERKITAMTVDNGTVYGIQLLPFPQIPEFDRIGN